MEPQQMNILDEDSHIIVCRKMPGIPVQTADVGRQDMVSLLKNYLASKGEKPEVYVAHRLDQPVEGLMVFAKSREAAGSLGRQLQQGNVDKVYHALVEGILEPEEGTMTDYLRKDAKNNVSRVVPPGTKGAKRATLSYRTLTRQQEQSLVEIRLKTGRHHQIRVQMAHAGHPLVGDRKYNPSCRDSHQPIRLCAVGLTFLHPATGQKKTYQNQNFMQEEAK